jgi:DNA-3-methyladenine glycosylase I
MKTLQRCDWAGDDPLYCAYHDTEWGVACHDDRKLFEMLILEGFQAGLSWITILRKRENFRAAFRGWDWDAIARFGANDIARLMRDRGIVRNRRKIEAAIQNARAFIRIREEFGTFDAYMWRFTNNTAIRRRRRARRFKDLPTRSVESDVMSADMKRRGFSFVGTVICYAHMQAVGMVDDHQQGCWRAGMSSHDRSIRTIACRNSLPRRNKRELLA